MTDDVQLRNVQPDDLPIFYEQQRDPAASRMAAFPMREREPFMAHWAKILRSDRDIQQTIVADGQVAGNIVCFYQGDQREVGYWLGREYWGRGVATRALELLLQQVAERPLYAMSPSITAARSGCSKSAGLWWWARITGRPTSTATQARSGSCAWGRLARRRRLLCARQARFACGSRVFPCYLCISFGAPRQN